MFVAATLRDTPAGALKVDPIGGSMTKLIETLRTFTPAIGPWVSALRCGLLQAHTVRVDRLG